MISVQMHCFPKSRSEGVVDLNLIKNHLVPIGTHTLKVVQGGQELAGKVLPAEYSNEGSLSQTTL